MNELETKLGNDIARQVAEKRDSLLSVIITERLGHAEWKLHAIAHRLGRFKVNDNPSETWTLDGKPLIELWPATCEMVREGERTRIVTSVKYRTFSAGKTPTPS